MPVCPFARVPVDSSYACVPVDRPCPCARVRVCPEGREETYLYRASKLGFWLRRLVDLKEQEVVLKSSMDAEVAQILKDKNILVWEEMLRSVDDPDMGVVEELRGGTDLVGAVGKTGLWPTKFQPALVTLDELYDIAKRDRAGLQQ